MAVTLVDCAWCGSDKAVKNGKSSSGIQIVRYEKELIGFAIVDKKGSEPSVDFNMAQFFKYGNTLFLLRKRKAF